MTPEAVVKLSKALADPTRFRLLQAIAATEEITCGALAARFPITQATYSQHLRVLADAGLIAMRREGQFNYYHSAGFSSSFGALTFHLGVKNGLQRTSTSHSTTPLCRIHR